MSSSRFSNLKDIFIGGQVFDYIDLDKSSFVYDKLVYAINKKLKLILFFGKPGVGKTFLLKKIYSDFNKKNNLVFLPKPFFDESEFFKTLYEKIFLNSSPAFRGYDDFLTTVSKKIDDSASSITVMVDEFQLYPKDLIEKIRLLSDSGKFKFLLTVHKTDKEDILAKEYFSTRIWESIELENSSLKEIKIYIEKKLIFHNKFEFINIFKMKHYKLIMNITDGNLRMINKLLFKLFELLEYYDITNPSKIDQNYIQLKYLKMAGIAQGMINA